MSDQEKNVVTSYVSTCIQTVREIYLKLIRKPAGPGIVSTLCFSDESIERSATVILNPTTASLWAKTDMKHRTRSALCSGLVAIMRDDKDKKLY